MNFLIQVLSNFKFLKKILFKKQIKLPTIKTSEQHYKWPNIATPSSVYSPRQKAMFLQLFALQLRLIFSIFQCLDGSEKQNNRQKTSKTGKRNLKFMSLMLIIPSFYLFYCFHYGFKRVIIVIVANFLRGFFAGVIFWRTF